MRKCRWSASDKLKSSDIRLSAIKRAVWEEQDDANLLDIDISEGLAWWDTLDDKVRLIRRQGDVKIAIQTMADTSNKIDFYCKLTHDELFTWEAEPTRHSEVAGAYSSFSREIMKTGELIETVENATEPYGNGDQRQSRWPTRAPGRAA